MPNNEKQIYTKDALLVTDDEIFGIRLYDESAKDFEKGVAYLRGDYYYVYRGEMDQNNSGDLYPEPGIYKDTLTNAIFRVDPYTPDDKKKYSLDGKISTIDPQKIIDAVNNKEEILIAIPESSKIFLPTLNNGDDILKRLIKKALIEKGIDIDQYKHRFVDKNALFNFKQVVKGDNKLSMLLFDRGCEALNLKYRIVIEECDSENYVGAALTGPIQASSEETYNI